MQYITNEHGQQVGVLLDMEAYQQLLNDKQQDPEILVGLSNAELQALANSKLASDKQARLDELIAQEKIAPLAPDLAQELDGLLLEIDLLTTLKTRALYTLQLER